MKTLCRSPAPGAMARVVGLQGVYRDEGVDSTRKRSCKYERAGSTNSGRIGWLLQSHLLQKAYGVVGKLREVFGRDDDAQGLWRLCTKAGQAFG